MATRTSNPDQKALTNTTHDDSTKAPALQSLYSLDQDTLNSSLQQSKNNKPDDPVVIRQASFFATTETLQPLLFQLPIRPMGFLHSNVNQLSIQRMA